jgi:hypothetical protein
MIRPGEAGKSNKPVRGGQSDGFRLWGNAKDTPPLWGNVKV